MPKEPKIETPDPAPTPADDTAAQIAAAQATARAEAETAMAEQLGMSVEDAQKLIADQEAARLAAMGEAERKEAEADAKIAEAEKKSAQADAREHAANVRDALIAAGAPVATASKTARLVDVAVGADEAAITAAVEATKAEYEVLFEGAPTPIPSPSTPGATAKTPPISDAKERAANRLAAMRASGKIPHLRSVANGDA